VRLLVATTNRNKVREIRALLSGLDLELVTLEAWPAVGAPDETGRTFDENARTKALSYADATGELTVAEDSGLEIDALGGAPGVESARFGGVDATYPEKFAIIYERMRASGRVDSPARFVCALALARGGQMVDRGAGAPRVIFETRGVIEGRVAPAPAGSGGFGYDPIFFYPPYGCTLAEATAEQKSAVSHRGQAFRKLRAYLEAQNS
jgi:XTP/dITP diphosphohydrolase